MLSKKKIKKIVWGGIYKPNTNVNYLSVRSDGNDQRYEYWVPAFNETNGEYYMINTYQREDYGSLERIVEKLEKLKKAGSHEIHHCYNFYYNSLIELNDDVFDKFDLVADLHDYEQTSHAYSYSAKDVIEGVQLYHEHAYPRGIDIVKKDAKINVWNEVEKKCQDVLKWTDTPHVSNYHLMELREILENEKGEFNRTRVEALLKLCEKVKELEDEYNNFYHNIQDDLYHDIDKNEDDD